MYKWMAIYTMYNEGSHATLMDIYIHWGSHFVGKV